MAMRTIVLLALLSGISLTAADAPTISVSGLQINLDVPAMSEGGQPFTFESGTKLKLLVSSKSGGLVAFDEEGSAFTAFKDDKGTDLLAKKKNAMTPLFGGFPRLSEDRSLLEIEADAPQVPAKGSTKIIATGTLSISCASQKNTVSQAVKLANGAKVTLGAISFSIEKVGKPEWGEEPLQIDMRSSDDLSAIAALTFTKADGSAIKATRGSSWSGGGTSEWNYLLGEKVDAVTITATIWTDLKKQQIPFDLTIDVGL